MLCKEYLHEKYGPTQPGPCAPSLGPSCAIVSTSSTAEREKQAHIHKLFNRWVPLGTEFHNKYPAPGLTHDEIRTILDEIVDYRVKTALAAA